LRGGSGVHIVHYTSHVTGTFALVSPVFLIIPRKFAPPALAVNLHLWTIEQSKLERFSQEGMTAMLNKTLSALALACLLAAPAVAQESATLVLRSGERVSGDLVDMGGADFTMNVNGQERRIPLGEVTVIDSPAAVRTCRRTKSGRSWPGGR
jgi:hypothetical protein